MSKQATVTELVASVAVGDFVALEAIIAPIEVSAFDFWAAVWDCHYVPMQQAHELATRGDGKAGDGEDLSLKAFAEQWAAKVKGRTAGSVRVTLSHMQWWSENCKGRKFRTMSELIKFKAEHRPASSEGASNGKVKVTLNGSVEFNLKALKSHLKKADLVKLAHAILADS